MNVTRQGELMKWTNYVNGWQTRYFILCEGVLTYYASRLEIGQGCKGSVNVCDCEIRANTENPLAFQITTGGVAFYLKAETVAEKQAWLVALGSVKSQSHATITSKVPKANSSLLLCDEVVQRVLALRETILALGDADNNDIRCLKACNSFLEIMCNLSLTNDTDSTCLESTGLTQLHNDVKVVECNGTNFNHHLGEHPHVNHVPEPFVCLKRANLIERLFSEDVYLVKFNRLAFLNVNLPKYSTTLNLIITAIPSNQTKSTEHFFAALATILNILNAIDVSSTSILKMDVADCLQSLKVMLHNAADGAQTLSELLEAESKLKGEIFVAKECMERLRRILVFLQYFFLKLHLADAQPSACALEAYRISMKEKQAVFLRYLFTEYAQTTSTRQSIANGLAVRCGDGELDFKWCASKIVQCLDLFDLLRKESTCANDAIE